MSYTADQILSFALDFERATSESLVKSAKKKDDKKSKKLVKKEDKASSDKSKADAKEKDSKKKKLLPKKKSFIVQFDNLISKFAQESEEVRKSTTGEYLSSNLPDDLRADLENIVQKANSITDEQFSRYAKDHAQTISMGLRQGLNATFNLDVMAKRVQLLINVFDATGSPDMGRKARQVYSRLTLLDGKVSPTAGGGDKDRAGRGGSGTGQVGSGDGSGKSNSGSGSGGFKGNSIGIKFRPDVRAAQIQFNKWNKQNGNYASSIDEDGKLGDKTKAAFHSYRPGVDFEEIIKDLSEQGMTWNVRSPEKSVGNQPPPIASELDGKKPTRV